MLETRGKATISNSSRLCTRRRSKCTVPLISRWRLITIIQRSSPCTEASMVAAWWHNIRVRRPWDNTYTKWVQPKSRSLRRVRWQVEASSRIWYSHHILLKWSRRQIILRARAHRASTSGQSFKIWILENKSPVLSDNRWDRRLVVSTTMERHQMGILNWVQMTLL